MPDLTVRLVLEGLSKREADLLYLMASDRLGRPLEAQMLVEIFRVEERKADPSLKSCSRKTVHGQHKWGGPDANKFNCPGMSAGEPERPRHG